MTTPTTNRLRTYLFLSITTMASAVLSSCAPSTSGSHQFLSDYSQLKQQSWMDDKITYEAGLEKIPNYKKIYLEDVRVFMPSDAAKYKISAEDINHMQRIFKKALTDEIRASRFSLASGPGRDTISLRAAVVDLKPGNPALFAATYAPYASSASAVISAAQGENMGAGSATIEAELLDSSTRIQLLAGIDKNPGSKLQVVEGLNRWGHIEAAFKEWAKDLRLAMEGKIRRVDL